MPAGTVGGGRSAAEAEPAGTPPPYERCGRRRASTLSGRAAGGGRREDRLESAGAQRLADRLRTPATVQGRAWAAGSRHAQGERGPRDRPRGPATALTSTGRAAARRWEAARSPPRRGTTSAHAVASSSAKYQASTSAPRCQRPSAGSRASRRSPAAGMWRCQPPAINSYRRRARLRRRRGSQPCDELRNPPVVAPRDHDERLVVAERDPRLEEPDADVLCPRDARQSLDDR